MGFKHLKFPENSVFLVTGAAGFIGSNLCEAILDMGYTVRALDDLSTGKQENVDMFADNPRYTFIKGDIKDLDTCMKACEGVDYVLNQAAWGSVPRSIEMPLFYSSSRITHEIRAQSEIRLHREYNLAMKFNSRSRELARDSGQRKLTSSKPNPCASSRSVYLSGGL